MVEKEELLDLLLNKKFDDIRIFIEFFDDLDEEFLKIEDIYDLEKCVLFIENLKNSKNDSNLLNQFVKLIDLIEFKNIKTNLNNIKSKINEIKEGYNKSLNDEIINENIIKCISNESEFLINFDKSTKIYNCKCNYKKIKIKLNKKNNNENKIEKQMDDIIILKEKAILRFKNKGKDQYFEICQSFIKNINYITNILFLINEINKKGYPDELKISIYIKNSLISCDNYANIENYIEELKEKLKNIEEFQKEFYKNEELLRLIYGRQLSEIFDYIKNKKGNLNYLNKYLTNNNIKKNFEIQYKKFDNNNLIDMYKNCINYIKKLFESCDFSISKLFNPSNINKENIENYKGLFIYYFPSEFLEQYVLNIYLNLTNNLPIYQTILFCNQETNKEEIFSFLYRAMLCEENILFTIIKPENLDLDSSNYLYKIYNDIYNNINKNIKSFILIVYSSTNNLINQFKKIGKINLNNIEYKKNDNNLNDLNDIKIYLSDVSGRGKSKKIKNDFKLFNNYEYFYFPIGGNITRKNIIDRLQELKEKKIALHIDLIETNKIDLIKNFLFSFLITKCYSLQENIFYFGEEIKIKIEIPVSFENYLF